MTKRTPYADVYEEGTDKYEWTHVDPIALNDVFDIVKRLRRAEGSLVRNTTWYDKACPSLKCVINLYQILKTSH